MKTATLLALSLAALVPACGGDGHSGSTGAGGGAPDGGPPGSAIDEEFVGPLAGWADAKKDYGAVGDGSADDTAALQKALDEVGQDGKPSVVYLPQGTYKITQTLQITSRLYPYLVGEDPEKTTLLWAGAAGEAMFVGNGLSYAKIGRLTFDGGGAAAVGMSHMWDGSVDYFPTHTELHDLVFENLDTCLLVGDGPGGNAEVVVKRARFLGCATGMKVENWNALDWFVWDSLFDENDVGLENVQGNFHVYRSLFRKSKTTDVKIDNKGYFGFRHNHSVGSNRVWMDVGPSGNPDFVAFQGNVIIDPVSPDAVQINCMGPLQMTDNVVRSLPGQTGPVVRVADFGPAAGFSLGNTFTRDGALEIVGASFVAGDKVVAASSLDITPPDPTPFAPKVTRPVIEVAAGGDIQAAVQKALTMKGQRPVVHVARGDTGVASTITIPAGADLQLLGDGGGTHLGWSGSDGGPVIEIMGPSHAVLRDFVIDGAGKSADGVHVRGIDQPGARVVADQPDVNVCASGFDVRDLTEARVELRAMYFGSSGEGLHVANPKGSSLVLALGGATSNTKSAYVIEQDSRAVVQDVWYEGGDPVDAFIRARDRASFAFQLGRFAPSDASTQTLDADASYAGTLSVLGLSVTPAKVSTGPIASDGFILFGGSGAAAQGDMTNGSGANAAFAGNVLTGGTPGAAPDQGTLNQTNLTRAFALVREAKPSDTTAATPAGASDVRLHRVWVVNGKTAFTVAP